MLYKEYDGRLAEFYSPIGPFPEDPYKSEGLYPGTEFHVACFGKNDYNQAVGVSMTKYGGKVSSPEEYITFLEGVVNERDGVVPDDLKETHERARLNAVIKRRDKTIAQQVNEIKYLEERCESYKKQIASMGSIVRMLDEVPVIRDHVFGILKAYDEMLEEAREY